MKIFLTLTFVGLLTLPVLAQTAGTTTQVGPGTTAPAAAPAKAIGPAPANSPQGKVLDSALSSQTRQTLAEAMKTHPADPQPASK